MSEIVRAGIQSVDQGQTEAAKSLGMTYRLTMSRIVLPQALRVIIPPLGNEFNNMLKTTSLLTIIAVQEMLRVAQSQAIGDIQVLRDLLCGRAVLPPPHHASGASSRAGSSAGSGWPRLATRRTRVWPRG